MAAKERELGGDVERLLEEGTVVKRVDHHKVRIAEGMLADECRYMHGRAADFAVVTVPMPLHMVTWGVWCMARAKCASQMQCFDWQGRIHGWLEVADMIGGSSYVEPPKHQSPSQTPRHLPPLMQHQVLSSVGRSDRILTQAFLRTLRWTGFVKWPTDRFPPWPLSTLSTLSVLELKIFSILRC